MTTVITAAENEITQHRDAITVLDSFISLMKGNSSGQKAAPARPYTRSRKKNRLSKKGLEGLRASGRRLAIWNKRNGHSGRRNKKLRATG